MNMNMRLLTFGGLALGLLITAGIIVDGGTLDREDCERYSEIANRMAGAHQYEVTTKTEALEIAEKAGDERVMSITRLAYAGSPMNTVYNKDRMIDYLTEKTFERCMNGEYF